LLLAGGYDTSDLINEEKFDRLFNLIKKHPECAKEVDFLLLDEGHDTDKNQFDFIFDIVKPKNWCVVADIKQTIYEWRGAYPQYIVDLIDDPSVAIYNLSYNYRCKKTILNFAKRLISKLGYEYEDNSIAVNPGGKVFEADYSLNAVAQVIHTDGNYRDWFVLTRSNSEIEQLGLLFDKARIPYATFKQGDITLEQLNEELKKDQVLVLTVHSAKGLERPKVAAVGMAPWWNKKEEETRVNYVAATRAKDLLIWMPAAPRKKKQTMNWE
jgi:superfamily I DNA/RNA helicase